MLYIFDIIDQEKVTKIGIPLMKHGFSSVRQFLSPITKNPRGFSSRGIFPFTGNFPFNGIFISRDFSNHRDFSFPLAGFFIPL